MQLKPGVRLGPYEILSAIGAGGMGEVWKARDTRLDRTVAIKTSRAEFDERFEREARAIAALNHPHICQLYDVGPNFLVMEFVEGHALKGPLPLDQALSVAIQLADALDAAHRKGIAHRDLKPANALMTKSGVKVLDFGLAKLEQARGAGIGGESVTRKATVQGTIVGTLQYMAPEQLQAMENVDSRADIFSFGCILYEMLTGKKAFDGGNAASIIVAVMERPAPSISDVAPAALDRLLRTCLAKDPDDRWQTVRDVKRELVWIAGGAASLERPAEPRARRGPWLAAAAALTLAAATGVAVWILKPGAPRPATRLVMDLAPGERLANPNTPLLAISPNGENVVYVAGRAAESGGSGPQQLFLRPLDALKAEPMAGTEGAVSPFFSPDSQWVAFFADNKLKKVPITGGASVTICEASGFAPGGTWGHGGTILFSARIGGVMEVAAGGGTPRRLTNGRQQAYSLWPAFAPDGGSFLFAGGDSMAGFAAVSSIFAGAPDKPGKDLVPGTAPLLTATGNLVYARNASLFAVPFDSGKPELTGSPVPVLEGVRESSLGAAQYGISTDGTLAYIAGGVQGSLARLTWVNRAGGEQLLAAPPRGYQYPRLSPDQTRIAVQISENTSDIWLHDLARDALSRVTFSGSANMTPVWSPDSSRIAFGSNRLGPVSIFWQPADGSGSAERLTVNSYLNSPRSFSPDGTMAYTETNPESGIDIVTMRPSDRKAMLFLKTPANEAAVQFSPDGHFLAYTSDASGHYEIYVQAFPGPGGKWQISNDGGTEPMWSPRGNELFYRSGNRMMAAPVTLQPGFSPGRPVELFKGPWLPTDTTVANYDVSRDGQRFLMLKPEEDQTGARQIVVVQNWLEEVKKKLAAGKK